ncbi:hypothetical protein AU378_18085 [Chryseobacterium kwangjuense]|uniref:Uncharacterized protein n=1 Tax=Chryseobacterium kwangjuense TaxID=267125 RepID=A0A135W9N9_9FLAO|nr:hypothetical protein AU378_18085 [Chryseobacterium kwangjuense]
MTEILNSRTPACQLSEIPAVMIAFLRDRDQEISFSGLQDGQYSVNVDRSQYRYQESQSVLLNALLKALSNYC